MDAIAEPEAVGRPIDLAIEGMHCASCARKIERTLNAVPGAGRVSVNLATERARVEVGRDGPGDAALLGALREAGYTASVIGGAETPPTRTSAPVWPVIGAFACALPLAVDMGVAMFGGPTLVPGVVQFVLGSIVQFVFGFTFYRGAWRAIRAGGADMDVLVVLGSSVAWAASTLALSGIGLHAAPAGADDVSFASAALIIAFVRFGKWLETGARRRTAAALMSLGQLRPERARVRKGDAVDMIALDRVRVGMIVEVRAGERIPVDGIVVDGRAAIDLSLLTGESVPVERGVGYEIPAGALATDATLLLKTRAVGAETTLARIVRSIEGTLASKAPVERLVDRIARIFVPAILAIALLGFMAHLALGHTVTEALSVAVAVLVIACPCALGLATPVAILVGTGNAGRRGILIKDAAVFERARTITRVAFDKTGTLTEGRPELVDIVVAEGETEASVLAAASSLQAGSLHPLAAAIRLRAPDASPALDARTQAGRGVSGTVGGATMMIGNARLLDESGVTLGALERAAREMEAVGRTVAFVATQAPTLRALGVFGFADRPRARARDAIAALHAQGVETAMLTGDGDAAASTIAAAVGIDEVHAGLLPDDKAALVAGWQSEGARVAMVGDGINDGVCLATADLGIAMAQGADIAIEAADVALLRADLMLVPAVIGIGRATTATIRQGLFWAFAYNAIGVPLALLGLVPPAFAGAVMALSSISVVGNALLRQDRGRVS